MSWLRRRKRFGFVARPPERVGELAKTLGAPLTHFLPLLPPAEWGPLPQHITGVNAHFRWDMYHERPVETEADVARRELTDYTVWFRSGRVECEAALESAYGPPGLVAGKRRYGPFFVTAKDEDRFELEWYASEPDWAIPPVDEVRRARAVAELAARLEEAAVLDDLRAALAALPVELGMAAVGRQVKFSPPMPAVLFARAIGQPDAIAKTVDVHMSTWMLAVPGAGWPDRPRLGPWKLDVLVDRPTGPEPTGIDAPAALVRTFADTDVVRVLHFGGGDELGEL